LKGVVVVVAVAQNDLEYHCSFSKSDDAAATMTTTASRKEDAADQTF